MAKKVYKQEYGFSALTKNLNWKIFTKNLVTSKRWNAIKMKYFNIMEVHWKIRFMVGVTKNQ